MFMIAAGFTRSSEAMKMMRRSINGLFLPVHACVCDGDRYQLGTTYCSIIHGSRTRFNSRNPVTTWPEILSKMQHD
ncbi:unnamed protein product, partial [Mycena citricolor]